MTNAHRSRSPSTLPPEHRLSTFVLYGLDCGFTVEFLNALVSDDVIPVAIVLPGPPALKGVLRSGSAPATSPPLLQPGYSSPSISDIASRLNVPLFRAGNLRSARTTSELRNLGGDAVITACFNRKIPMALLDSYRFGGINVHPSLLPDLRGPDPLFWTFRRNDRETGVTLHKMTPEFDAGPIIEQQAISITSGATESNLERILAVAGAKLTRNLLSNIEKGLDHTIDQDPHAATYAPHPEPEAFCVRYDFTVDHAYNFVRGVEERGVPFQYVGHGGRSIRFVRILDRNGEANDIRVASAGNTKWIEFSDGWLQVESSDEQPHR